MHGDEMRSTRVDLRNSTTSLKCKALTCTLEMAILSGHLLFECLFLFVFFLYMWRELLGVVERHRIVVRVGSCVTGGDRHDLQFLEHANVGRVRNRRRQTSNSF
jgi:hypothetical protein